MNPLTEESAELRFPVVSVFNACVTIRMLGLFVSKKNSRIMDMAIFSLLLTIMIVFPLFVTVIVVVYFNLCVSHTFKID